MKAFLLKTLLYFFLLICIVLFILQFSSYEVNKNASFKLNSNPRFLIVGSSQSECAYNDSLIPDFKNMSQSGESFFYTYFKTSLLLKHNKSVETVFIDFSNIQIHPEMNDWTWDDKHISYRYPIYSSFMNFDDQLLLFKNNPFGFLSTLSFTFKYRFNKIVSNNYNFVNEVGGYLFLDRDKTDSLLNKIDSSQVEQNIVDKKKYSEINLIYLKKIIDLCKANDKKVYLLRSPQHIKSLNLKNDSLYFEILNTRFKNNEFLDFSKVPFTSNEFGDFDHLNYKGAKIYSLWFSQILKDGLLLKNNKQKFINQKINDRDMMILREL